MLPLFPFSISTRRRVPLPALPGLDDEALVAAVARGERDALGVIYDRFAGRVMAVLVRMLPTRAEADELLQEVFTELWQKAGDFDRARGKVSTWVITVARSRALDALRASGRRARGRHDPVEDLALSAPPASQPDAQATEAERSGAVRNALAQLTGPQREALELSYFAGLSHTEIADRLAIPVGTVKSRIIAGMKQLRDHLGELREDRP